MTAQFHYFATNPMGWATSDTRDSAIEKLLLKNTDPTWARNCLKSGEPLVIFVCRVPLEEKASYEIEWYVPVVEDITETENLLVTYLTKTKFAVMKDARDEVTKLTKKLKAAKKELSAVKKAAQHMVDSPDEEIGK